MNRKGKCVIKSQVIKVVKDMRPMLNIIRKRGMKFIFFMVDDLWLYQYHKRNYNGIVRKVLNTISFIEEKQWEIVGLEEPLKSMTRRVDDLPKYNPYSNKKYMEEARKNNYMISSLLDFLVFHVPFTFLVVFILNKIFYALFNYPISAWIRPYSFWLILLDLLIQNNIEFFTFLGFRNIQAMVSFTFESKCLNGFFILFLFVVFITMCSSYIIYLYK